RRRAGMRLVTQRIGYARITIYERRKMLAQQLANIAGGWIRFAQRRQLGGKLLQPASDHVDEALRVARQQAALGFQPDFRPSDQCWQVRYAQILYSRRPGSREDREQDKGGHHGKDGEQKTFNADATDKKAGQQRAEEYRACGYDGALQAPEPVTPSQLPGFTQTREALPPQIRRLA